jgi:hypothetical protein
MTSRYPLNTERRAEVMAIEEIELDAQQVPQGDLAFKSRLENREGAR